MTAAEVTCIPLVVAAAAERCVLIVRPFFVGHPVFGETVITKSTRPLPAIGARAGERLGIASTEDLHVGIHVFDKQAGCIAMAEVRHDGQVTGRQMGC